MKSSSDEVTGASGSRDRVAPARRNDSGVYDAMLVRMKIIDKVLAGHASASGDDYVAYRNHVYRVVNLCAAIAGEGGDIEKIAVAAVFHDLGIWTEKTFDYIAPSIALAREYMIAGARQDWINQISRMIADHHKITASTANRHSLVEPFRQADWIDVTGGLRPFGVPRPFVARLFAMWPDAGFHRRLVQLVFQRFRTHPLTSLPMVRL